MGKFGDLVAIGLQVDGDREPHSFEWAVAVASGAGSRPRRGIFPASSRIRAVVNLVKHCRFFIVPTWRFASAAQMNI